MSASVPACDERFAPLSAQRRFAWAVAARAALTNSLTVSALLADTDVEQVAEQLCTDPELFQIPPAVREQTVADLDRAAAVEAMLLTPEDPDWPTAAVADLERANDEWPRSLSTRLNRTMHPGPFALYLRGTARLDPFIERGITVTGSRAATGYGRAVTARIAAELTTLGWNVVAGSAYGVAAIAHKAALAADGYPVAVLAAGIDVAHPPGHSGLLATIATIGLLVSEYPPGTSVTRARRRAQSRLLAALSRAVLIIESTPGGEPATIAAHAVRHRVPVFAVPGPVTSATTALPHELIATGGARLITSGHASTTS
ncbi:hypothetical protein B7C42_07628 [Nocardia cerradoensis]|uniref:Smf/DprA SLOG domain-containing protein n=1 Tax=Nocardia cerradoensis TaxID=85688 RepID=A0A231GUJ1_9NOCA|nr:DNA-processing protein DprA [Nocardia cerradoensis]OXR40290.1 hypothetical protein B7C42_07628 [Nocardia cerradoensis]